MRPEQGVPRAEATSSRHERTPPARGAPGLSGATLHRHLPVAQHATPTSLPSTGQGGDTRRAPRRSDQGTQGHDTVTHHSDHPSSSHLKHRLERAQSRRPMRHGGDLGHRHRALPDLLHGHPEGQRGLGVPEAVGPRAPPRAGDYPPGLRAHSARLGRPRPSWRACRRRGTCAWQSSPPYAVPLRHGHHHSCGATRQLSSHRTGPTRPRRAPRRPHAAPACSGQQRLTASPLRRAPCVTAPSTPGPKAGTVCHRPSAEPSRQCPALWLQP